MSRREFLPNRVVQALLKSRGFPPELRNDTSLLTPDDYETHAWAAALAKHITESVPGALGRKQLGDMLDILACHRALRAQLQVAYALGASGAELAAMLEGTP